MCIAISQVLGASLKNYNAKNMMGDNIYNIILRGMCVKKYTSGLIKFFEVDIVFFPR